MVKALLILIAATLSMTSLADQAPSGMQMATALTTLRTVKCQKMNLHAIMDAKRTLIFECNYLAEKLELFDEQKTCEKELRKINETVDRCDAKKFKKIADNISDIIKRAMRKPHMRQK